MISGSTAYGFNAHIIICSLMLMLVVRVAGLYLFYTFVARRRTTAQLFKIYRDE
jgi:hypothetical protein